MKRTLRLQRLLKIFLNKFSSHIRLSIGIISFIFLIVVAVRSIYNTPLSNEAYAGGSVLGESTKIKDALIISSVQDVTYELSKPTDAEFSEAQDRYQNKLDRIAEEQRRIEEERQNMYMQRIAILESYLNNQASPMALYSQILFDNCIDYGLHYCKYFISIAGVETGFGRIHYGTFNAWGWGGKKFSGWDESIPYVSHAIAKYYYLNGYDTFEKLAYESSYGPHDKEKWVNNLYMYYNGIPDF